MPGGTAEGTNANAMRNRLLFGYELRNCGSYSGIWYVKSMFAIRAPVTVFVMM